MNRQQMSQEIKATLDRLSDRQMELLYKWLKVLIRPKEKTSHSAVSGAR